MALNGVSPPPFREALVERGPLTLTASWQRWVSAAVQTAGRVVTETGLWRWSTALSGAPASGDVAVNSADYMAATEVRINKTTRSGTEVSAVLDRLRVGDDLRIQQSNDASRTVLYRLTALPTNQGTWVSIPVAASSWGGLTIANNQDVVVTFGLHTGGSGGSTQPPLAGTGLADKVTLWQGASTLTYDGLLHYDRVQHWLGIGTATPAATLHVVGTTQVGSMGVGYAPPANVWLRSGSASIESLLLGGGDVAPRWTFDCTGQGNIYKLGVYYGPDSAAASGADFRTRHACIDWLGVSYVSNGNYSIRAGNSWFDSLGAGYAGGSGYSLRAGNTRLDYLGIGRDSDTGYSLVTAGQGYFGGTLSAASAITDYGTLDVHGVVSLHDGNNGTSNVYALTIYPGAAFLHSLALGNHFGGLAQGYMGIAVCLGVSGAPDNRFAIRSYAAMYCDGIPYSANPGPWQAYSDRRLKHNIHAIPHPLETMTRLHGVCYEYNDTADGKPAGVRMGVIAQEVEEVLPEWVGELSGFKTTQLSAFEALSIEAVKELATRVEKIRFRLSQFLGTPL